MHRSIVDSLRRTTNTLSHRFFTQCSIASAMAGSAVPACADLLITKMDTPTEACVGQDIGPDSRLRLKNQGAANANELFHVGWYLSADATLDSSDTLMVGGRDQVTSLAAGASTNVAINVLQVPDSAPLGAHYLIAFADEQDNITEESETNNVKVAPITISSCDGTCDGAFWAGARDERGSALTLLGSDNIIVGNVRPAGTSCLDCWDGFVTRVTTSGTRLWEQRVDNCDWDNVEDVTLAGDVVVTVGSYRSDSQTIPQIRGYASSGSKLWQTDFGPKSGNDTALAVAADLRSTSVVVSGSWNADRVLLARYTNDGESVWERSEALFTFFVGRAVAISPAGLIAVAGDSNVDSTNRAVTVALFDDGGAPLWALQLPSTHGRGTGVGVTFDSDGSVLVVSDDKVPSSDTRDARLYRLSSTGSVVTSVALTDPAFTRGLVPQGVFVQPGASTPFVVADGVKPVGNLVPYLARVSDIGVVASSWVNALEGTYYDTPDFAFISATDIRLLLQTTSGATTHGLSSLP